MKPYDQTLILPLIILLNAAAIHPAAASDLSKMEGVIADVARPGFTFKAEKPLVIADPVRIPREVSSVCSFVVEDGPAAADVIFNGGILEEGGTCGFTKDGPGSMRVAGEIMISGFIMVYDGSPDLSAASVESGLRIHLLGDARLIPPTGEIPLEIYINGIKLKPGTWGPPGSGVLPSPPSTDSRSRGLIAGAGGKAGGSGNSMTTSISANSGARPEVSHSMVPGWRSIPPWISNPEPPITLCMVGGVRCGSGSTTMRP